MWSAHAVVADSKSPRVLHVLSSSEPAVLVSVISTLSTPSTATQLPEFRNLLSLPMMATTSSDVEYLALGAFFYLSSRYARSVNRFEKEMRERGGPSNAPVQSPAISDPGRTSQAVSIQAVASPGMHGPSDGGSDFDSSANELWRLYGTEAQSDDEARIKPLKDDMEGVLLFTGLFAVVLTAFIIDSKQNLKVNPTDQMVYYLQQNVAMLDQISHQIFSIAPQFSIPSAPPIPFPDFEPSASDIRVNVFWFMSLVFSLFAALLATLVQQWVRNYTRVFQQYRDPLKSARLRQYLHEGSENWHMHLVAEAVLALLHLSLFLFFAGLCDFVSDINTSISLSTTIPISIASLLYITTTLAPVINPQSPYQNPFSGIIWWLTQKCGCRQIKNRRPVGGRVPVNSNMAKGQMELAMEETDNRMDRDVNAVRWLVSNMTEHAETEKLVMAMPGSFNGLWAEGVWNKVLGTDNKKANQNHPSHIPNDHPSITSPMRTSSARDNHANTAANSSPIYQPSPNPHSATHIQGVHTNSELSERVAHLLGTCKNKVHFTSTELWRQRTRACVETTSSLFSCTGDMPDQVGDMPRLLGDLGRCEKIRELSSEGRDGSFVMHWTCLSLLAIRPILESTSSLHIDAKQASIELERSDGIGETRLHRIMKAFDSASSCLDAFVELPVGRKTENEIKLILHKKTDQIRSLTNICDENAELVLHDWSIGSVQHSIDRITHEVITRQLPGVKADISDKGDDISQFVELYRDRDILLFISPHRNLRRIRSFAQTIEDILQEKDDALPKFQKTIKDLREIQFPLQLDQLFLRQMWRLQDLQDGGRGFIVELFFLTLKRLLSEPSSKELHSVLYLNTFRAITSDWSKYRISPGTQKLLLDMVTPYRGIIFSFDYPSYIVDAFLKFLGHILKGERGDHIDKVTKELTGASCDDFHLRYRALSTKVLHFIQAA